MAANTSLNNRKAVPFPVRMKQWATLLPGIATGAAIAAVSIISADYIGIDMMGFEKSPISAVVIVIILGMLLGNFSKKKTWYSEGLVFVSRRFLRIGIVLLGFKISVYDVAYVGIRSLPMVILCIIATGIITLSISNLFRLSKRLGILIAVGTTICGVSAIAAVSPAIHAKEEETTYAVSIITIFGLLATLVYPYAAYAIFDGDPLRTGLFLGTAIHDTSQVTGAALAFEQIHNLEGILERATVTKLLRNMLMVIIIPLSVYINSRGSSESHHQKKISVLSVLPLFVLGFLLSAAVRTAGDYTLSENARALFLLDAEQWSSFMAFISTISHVLIVTALGGIGFSVKIRTLRTLGIKPLIVGLLAASTVGLISFLSQMLILNL